MDNSSANTNNSINDLPWDKLVEVLGGELNSAKAASIPEETYQLAADPKNHDFLFKSALKSLKDATPDGYEFERAEALVGMMQIFARMILKELEAERNKAK